MSDQDSQDRPVLIEKITFLLEGACEMFRPTAFNLAEQIVEIVEESGTKDRE